MLGLSEATAEAIYALDEHWDGAGHPHGLRGEEIPLGARIGCLAQTLEIFWAADGIPGAYAVAERRRGEWFDPALVAALGADSRRRELLGLASDRGSQPNRARGPTTRGRQSSNWTESPMRSPPSSTPSRPGPTGTPTAPA